MGNVLEEAIALATFALDLIHILLSKKNHIFHKI